MNFSYRFREATRRLLAVLILLLPAFALAETAQGKLVFGVYPYLSASQVMAQFAPLRDYLEQTMGRRVVMVSSPNFNTFIERTARGEYDLIFTAPHMARLAEQRDGWRRVAQSEGRIVALLLVRNDSPLHGVENLRGKKIAVGSRQSITYQLIDRALRRDGLALGVNVEATVPASFSNVIHSVMKREVDVGATITAIWNVAPAEQRASLREIYRSEDGPGFLLMGNPQLDEPTLEKLRSALLRFNQQPAGRAFFRNTQLASFQPLDDAAMRAIDPFTAALLPKP